MLSVPAWLGASAAGGPLQMSFSKVLPLGGQMMSLSAGGKCWLDRADGSDAWGVTAGVVVIFAKGREG